MSFLYLRDRNRGRRYVKVLVEIIEICKYCGGHGTIVEEGKEEHQCPVCKGTKDHIYIKSVMSIRILNKGE